MQVFDTEDNETVDPKEPESGAETDATPKADETESQPAAATDLESGGEAGEVKEGGEGDGGEAPKTEVNSVAALQSRLDDVMRELAALKSVPEQEAPPAPAPAPREFTEEEWSHREQALGIPRTAIKEMARQAAYVYDRVKQEILAEFDNRLSRFEKSDAIRAIASDPNFSDATKYSKEIDEFLKDFDQKHHSNPDLLKRAIIYSRGLNMKSTVSKVRNEGERNRQISGAARPAAPTGGNRTRPVPLSPSQREAARLIGGEDEYRKFMKPRSNGATLIER